MTPGDTRSGSPPSWWAVSVLIIALMAANVGAMLWQRGYYAGKLEAVDRLEAKLAAADEDRGRFREQVASLTREVDRLYAANGEMVVWNTTLYPKLERCGIDHPPPPALPERSAE